MFLLAEYKNWKLRGDLFDSVTIAHKGLDPSKSKIIGIFSHESKPFSFGLQQGAQQ